MHYITSRHNARVKEAAKLRQRRQRDRQGRFLIDGVREIERAIASGARPVEAYLRQSNADAPALKSLTPRLEMQGARISIVADVVYDKLSFGDRAEGLVVVARSRPRSLQDLDLPPGGLVAVIESLEKPGNVGAILRSADGAGIDAVIVANPQSDLYNPNTIRSSLGTVFSASVCWAPSQDARQWLADRDMTIYAARPDATQLYTDVHLASGAAIVLGSEAKGLSPVWSDDEVVPVRLPMLGVADSLNVSAAAAALFYEARRQRDAACPT